MNRTDNSSNCSRQTFTTVKIDLRKIPRLTGIEWRRRFEKNGWRPRKRGEKETSKHLIMEKSINGQMYSMVLRRTREEIYPPMLKGALLRARIPSEEIEILLT